MFSTFNKINKDRGAYLLEDNWFGFKILSLNVCKRFGCNVWNHLELWALNYEEKWGQGWRLERVCGHISVFEITQHKHLGQEKKPSWTTHQYVLLIHGGQTRDFHEGETGQWHKCLRVSSKTKNEKHHFPNLTNSSDQDQDKSSYSTNSLRCLQKPECFGQSSEWETRERRQQSAFLARTKPITSFLMNHVTTPHSIFISSKVLHTGLFHFLTVNHRVAHKGMKLSISPHWSIHTNSCLTIMLYTELYLQ